MDTQPATRPTREQIATCAYLIWEKEGRPKDRHAVHWLQAEKQLLAVCFHDMGTLPPAKTPTAGKSRRQQKKDKLAEPAWP